MARAGMFRDQITFARRSQTDDGLGNVVSGDPMVLFTVWADMLERLGGERLEAGALHAPRLATIRVRSSLQTRRITEADVIRARGELWNIRSVAALGRNRAVIEFTCERDVAI